MGNFVRLHVIDTGELGDFLGEDCSSLVGNLLGVFRAGIGNGDFEHLRIFDIGDGDALGKLVGLIVEMEVVDDLLKDKAAFNEFTVGRG